MRTLATVFRGKYLDGLRQAHRSGRLHFGAEAAVLAEAGAFGSWLTALQGQRWIVYAKRPFAGARQVVRYLGRYTHRGPIANARLRSLEAGRVCFDYKDYRAAGARKEMELSAEEFIRRYLLHVLPRGFVRIRYYGLYARAGRAERLARCRALVSAGPDLSADHSEVESSSTLQPAEARGERRCTECGSLRLVRQMEWHAGERPPIPAAVRQQAWAA